MIVRSRSGNVRVPHAARAFPFADGRPATHRPSAGQVPLLGREELVATYEKIYRSQPWVWTVVQKLIKATWLLPLKTYELTGDGDGDRERLRDHDVAKLLRNPWPLASAAQLKEHILGCLGIYGNALLLKVRTTAGRAPSELWPIPWRHVEVEQAGSTGVLHFIFHGAKAKYVILPEETVHFRFWGAGGAVGISPLEALRRTLALEDAAQQWSASHFQRGATPSGLFRTEGKLKDGTARRIRAELEELYGGVENAGRFAVLDQGLDYKPVQHSAVDAALIEQRKLSREEVAAAYDLPAPVIGILDRATFSNIETQHRMLYMDSMSPILTMLEETLQVQLLDPEPSWNGIFTEFDLNAVLAGDPVARANAYGKLLQGILTPNEIRKLENRPRIDTPEADQLYVPVNLRPAAGEPLKERIEMLGSLVRAGFDPDSAAALLQVDVAHSGLAPVTVQRPPKTTPEPEE